MQDTIDPRSTIHDPRSNFLQIFRDFIFGLASMERLAIFFSIGTSDQFSMNEKKVNKLKKGITLFVCLKTVALCWQLHQA